MIAKYPSSAILYVACFFAGAVSAGIVWAIWTGVSFLSLGYEIQSKRSPMNHHFATLYTRPGTGDQTFSLVVDGVRVYRSPDAAPGAQDEELRWNAAGTLVSLEYSGERVLVYDAEGKRRLGE